MRAPSTKSVCNNCVKTRWVLVGRTKQISGEGTGISRAKQLSSRPIAISLKNLRCSVVVAQRECRSARLSWLKKQLKFHMGETSQNVAGCISDTRPGLFFSSSVLRLLDQVFWQSIRLRFVFSRSRLFPWMASHQPPATGIFMAPPQRDRNRGGQEPETRPWPEMPLIHLFVRALFPSEY